MVQVGDTGPEGVEKQTKHDGSEPQQEIGQRAYCILYRLMYILQYMTWWLLATLNQKKERQLARKGAVQKRRGARMQKEWLKGHLSLQRSGAADAAGALQGHHSPPKE